MILLGLLLLILGLVLGIGILYTIGIVLIIIGAVLWILGSLTDYVGQDVSQGLANFMSYISFNSRLQGFIRGLVDTRDIVYFISVTVLALVFSFRALERRKWA